MNQDKVKVFKDTVHGYIEIPSVIVSNIIDTEQFQRLRYIEQTSMRSLYPAARHDRFIHSLGVYYLGKLAFQGFKNNSSKVIDMLKENDNDKDSLALLNDTWWEKQQLLFEIACLMHDCAHAPFSHTLEQYYYLKVDADANPRVVSLLYEICEELGDKDFKQDMYSESNSSWCGAPHEQLSSYIILKEYREAINNIFVKLLPSADLRNDDYVFICRMIIGCKYKENNVADSLKNCIISLLNSSTIDVDGLDYIVRDAQMSGISTYSVDYQRILNSFTVLPVACFDNEYFDKESIAGLWLKDTRINIVSSLEGRFCGRVRYEGKDLTEAVTARKGTVVCEQGNCTVTPNNNSDVDIRNAKEGSMELLATSKFISGMLNGYISGNKVILPEDIKGDKISFVLGYDKRCLSIIQNIIDARNNEYIWVYTHPKVLYNSNYLQCGLLVAAAEYLKRILNTATEEIEEIRTEECIVQILGYEEVFDDRDRIIREKLKKLKYYFRRSNDDDINSLFKRIYLEIKGEDNHSGEDEEFLGLYDDYYGRKQRRVFWKSFMEKAVYANYCKSSSSEFKGINRFLEKVILSISVHDKSYEIISDNWKEKGILHELGFDNVLVIGSKAKTKKIDLSEFFVKYGDRCERLCDIFEPGMINDGVEKKIEYIFYDGEEIKDFMKIVDLDKKLEEMYWG